MVTLQEVNKEYNLQLNEIIEQVKENDFKLILLQFPDGLKPYAITIVNYLRENTTAEFLIWMGSCFGACDTPVLTRNLESKIDLIVQFGHNSLMPSY